MITVKEITTEELSELGKGWERGIIGSDGNGIMSLDREEIEELCKDAPEGDIELFSYTGKEETFFNDFVEEIKAIYPESKIPCGKVPISTSEFSIKELGNIAQFVSKQFGKNGKTILFVSPSTNSIFIAHNDCDCEGVVTVGFGAYADN